MTTTHVRPLAKTLWLLALLSVCGLPLLSGQQFVSSTFAGLAGVTGSTASVTTTSTSVFAAPGDGGPANGAILVGPTGVAWSGGTLFIVENAGQRVRQVDNTLTINTIAGTGTSGYTGDGGVATNASFTDPQGITVDSSGNLYVADTNNHVIRIFQIGGSIATFAGNGTSGFSGDGGAATSAQLQLPRAVVADVPGNLYIADGNLIRKVAVGSMNISTIGGGVLSGFSGDGGPAVNAQFNNPQGICLDGNGNLYIADTYNQRVRKISTTGIVTTVAGNGTAGYAGDGGLAVNATLNAPTGVVFDSLGNYYILEHSRVRRVTSNNSISTVIGTTTDGYYGDGGLGNQVEMNTPNGITVDSSGNLYVADTNNNVVRMFSPTVPAAVTNAASNLQGAVAPGEIVTIYGTALAPDPLLLYTIDTTNNPNGVIDPMLNMVQVNFNEFPAPIIYESSTQVAVIVPYEIAGSGSTVGITVINNGVVTAGFTAGLVAAQPEVFSRNNTGSGQAAAVNQDGSLNSAANPAGRGTVISLYATGTGQTTPGGVDGRVEVSSFLPQTTLPVSVTFGGVAGTVQYSGAAPGNVAGLTQINVLIPPGLTPGNAVPVKVFVGTGSSMVVSQATTTVAIK